MGVRLLNALSHLIFTFTHTFTIANLLFNVVHFQVFRNWSSPEENNDMQVRGYSVIWENIFSSDRVLVS